MTSLKGNLNSVDLANIFQMLSMNQREGTLYIFDGQSRKAIYFGHDGVSMLTRGKHKPDALGRILIRFDRLTPESLAEALRLQDESSGRLLGHILVEQGLVTRADVEDALKTQIEEEVYSLFIWKDAQFEFVEGPPDDELQSHDGVTKLTFNVNSLIMEAAKRVDEWEWIQRVLPAADEIFRYTGNNVGLEDEIFTQTFAGKVLAAIDGRRSVDEVVEASFAGRFEVTKILALLLEGGAIEPLPVEELKREAGTSVAAGDMPAAVKFLSRLVAVKADSPDMHRQLAEAFEARKQIERAAFHYKVYAEVLVGNGERRGAFEIYRRIVELLPTDLAAADRLVEIFASNTEGLEEHAARMIQLGKSTAESWVELRRQSRAIQVLHRVVSLGPDDQDLRTRLIQVYLQGGMTTDAISEYDAMAETAIAVRDYDQAEKIYRKILAIDRGREDAVAKLNQILSRKRLRQRGIRIALFGGVLLCAGLYGGLEAWKSYRERQRIVTEQSARFRSAFSALKEQHVALHGKIGESLRAMTTAGAPEQIATVLVENAPARAELERQAEAAAQLYFALVGENPEIPDAQDADYAGRALQGKIRDLKTYENQLRGQLADKVESLWEGIDDKWARLPIAELDTELRRILGLSRATPDWLASPKGIQAQGLSSNVNEILAGWSACRTAVASAQTAGDVLAEQAAVLQFLETWLNPAGIFEEILIPRSIATRPAGARILVDGQDTELRTPGVVRLPIARTSKVTLEFEGFQNSEIDFPMLRVVDKQRIRDDLKLSAELVLVKDVMFQTQGSPEKIAASPIVVGDRVFVATRGKSIDVFDTAKGGRQKSLTISTKVRPAEVNGTLVIPSSDRSVYFVRASDLAVSREPGRGLVSADPVVCGTLVVVADLDGHITAYSPATRAEAWRYPQDDAVRAGFASRPVHAAGKLYAVSVDGKVVILDAQTGAPEAAFAVRDGGIAVAFTSGVAPSGDLLYAVVRGGDPMKPSVLFAFDRKGEVRWKESFEGDVRWTPFIWQGTAWLATTSGQVYGIRVHDRPERLRSLTAMGQILAEPLLDDGFLYVGDTSGMVCAWDLRGSEAERAWDFRLTLRDGKPSRVTSRPAVSGDLILISDETHVFGVRR